MNIGTVAAVRKTSRIRLKYDGIVGRGVNDHSSLNPGMMICLELQTRNRAGENEMDALLAVGSNKQVLCKL